MEGSFLTVLTFGTMLVGVAVARQYSFVRETLQKLETPVNSVAVLLSPF